jgi:Cu+-exporting ATPase
MMKRYGKTITLNVNGMTCQACVSAVEQALRNVAGVKEARVNLENKEAMINIIPGDTDPERLIQAVKMAGYDASLAE